MSEADFSSASYQLAAWTLRFEYEATWSSERPSWTSHALPILVAFYEFEVDGGNDAPRQDDDRCAPGSLVHAPAATTDSAEAASAGVPLVRPPSRDEGLGPATASNRARALGLGMVACALLTVAGWRLADLSGACRLSDHPPLDTTAKLAAELLAARIVIVESNGDAAARNGLSTATGAGQFLDGTWLDMIRAYRPDLGARAEREILDLRYDPELSREMVARFAEQNAAMLARRCLPVTPGTLYLSHFAGGAGAAAVLSAPEHADAAAIMAKADSTGRTTREMIVTANPFLASFTVADLKSWADRKMGIAGGRGL